MLKKNDINPIPYNIADEMEKNTWLPILITVFGVLAIIFLLMGNCYPYSIKFTEANKTLAIIGEAENQPQEGKEAVACAINNRGTLRGVYGLRSHRVKAHLYNKQTYIDAWIAVQMAEDKQYCDGLIHGAQYWASLKVDQKWIKKMEKAGYKRTAKIGDQVFYKERGK